MLTGSAFLRDVREKENPMISDDQFATAHADPASPAAKPDAAGGANLDKVRDILFGTHMREVERRFARLEERLIKDTNALKDNVKRRLDALESYIRQETEALAGQLKSEHEDRSESDERSSQELKDTARALERRISSVDDQSSKGQREMRQLMLE